MRFGISDQMCEFDIFFLPYSERPLRRKSEKVGEAFRLLQVTPRPTPRPVAQKVRYLARRDLPSYLDI